MISNKLNSIAARLDRNIEQERVLTIDEIICLELQIRDLSDQARAMESASIAFHPDIFEDCFKSKINAAGLQ